ncbi:hypothetical protein [Butyrivibrio sp. XPD2006]|uniref:hypothetical protein n=1 Tax=Butyrivibrio sp. XPD2006 TaxID=1280668 RepID=UPI0003B352AF|nr:hypothetical protein [Butyrivibrio sp. XPD2006]
MEILEQITAILIGALISATCATSGNADELLTRFIEGDVSVLEENQKEEWFIPDFNDGSFEYEYTLLDLDGDGENEMIVQMKDEPQGFSAVFNAERDKVYCWGSDSVEMNCFEYPLDNGMMVSEYDYDGAVSYSIYAYDTTGEAKHISLLFIREVPASNNAAVKYPDYRIDDKEVTKEEFGKELKAAIGDHRLDRTSWILVK